MAEEVGHAFVSLLPSARGFSARARKELKTALAGVSGEVQLEPDVDVTDAAAAGVTMSNVAEEAAPPVELKPKVNRRLVARAFRAAFTSNPQILQAMRTGIPAVLSSPVGLAAVAVAGSFALSFVGALASSFLAAGLPAVFLGLGVFLLKDNKTIVKGFEGMVDQIKSAFDGVADSLIGPIREAMDLVGASAERVAPMVETLMEAFSPALVPIVEGLLGVVENFLGTLASDPKAMQGMTDALIAFGEHLPRVGTALAGFFSTLASNENTVKNIGPIITFLSGAVGVLGSVISFWTDGFNFWVEAWHRLQDTVGTVVGAVGTAAGAVGAAAAAVGGFFAELPGKIGSAVSTAWAAITGFASQVFAWFAALPGAVAGFLAKLPGRVASIFKKMALGLLYWIGFGVTKAVIFVTLLPQRLGRLFRKALDAAVAAVQTGIAAVVDFFRKLPGRAAQVLSFLWGRIRGAFTTAREGAKRQGRSLVDGFIDFMQRLPGRAARAAGRVKDAILGAFRGAAGWLFDAGKDILLGLANGVKGAIGAAVDAAKEAAGAVLSGVRDALGIGSPSKVMRDEVGHWIPVGIAEGIRLNEDAARDALGELTAQLAAPGRMLAAPGSLQLAGAPAPDAGTPVEFVAEVPIELGEDLEKVVQVKMRRKDRDTVRRVNAGSGRVA